MAAQTYTITSATFEAESGDNISTGANPTVTLVISPAAGYTLTHTNFSIGEALPSEVASAVFSQDGDNVNCLVTFDAGFVMPSSDVELLIDIDGTADEQTFTINGSYSTLETNTTTVSTDVNFSQTDVDGTIVTLFTKTFTAASGYYFATPPYYYQTQGAQRNDDAYIITYTDNALGDIVTSRSYTVKYLIDGQSKTLNDLNFVANAELIYVPKTGITSYDISLAKIQITSSTRIITAYGNPGDEFIISTTAPYPVDSAIDDANNVTLIIPDKYNSVSHMLVFPANTTGSNQTWTFTFSGDLSASFSQTNPLSIIQLG
jgi:hypothetical protein